MPHHLYLVQSNAPDTMRDKKNKEFSNYNNKSTKN
jgi:hypothetical protein